MSDKSRLSYIDISKGWAILMVLVGHLAQFCVKGESADGVFNFVYSFHMPLFFFLSGYVVSLSRDKINYNLAWTFVLKKMKSLLIPFFVWGVVIYLMCNHNININEIGNRVVEVFVKPDGNAPWFLITLFSIQMFFLLFCLISNIISNNKIAEYVGGGFVAFIIIGGYVITKQIFYFNLTYSAAFFVGYFYKRIFDGQINKYYYLILFLLFCDQSWRFDLNLSPSYLKMLIGIAASILVMKIARNIDLVGWDYGIVGDLLKYIGKHTLEIYVVQCFGLALITEPLEVSNISSIFLFTILLIISIFLSALIITLSKMLDAIPYVGLLLFGKAVRDESSLH